MIGCVTISHYVKIQNLFVQNRMEDCNKIYPTIVLKFHSKTENQKEQLFEAKTLTVTKSRAEDQINSLGQDNGWIL